jgi:hypothetical protein
MSRTKPVSNEPTERRTQAMNSPEKPADHFAREGEYDNLRPEAASEHAPSEPAGPSGSLRCDGVVGPLSREEVLTLKIAEHVLCRDQLSLAVASLLRGVRKAGKSGVQKLVLAADLEELERRMQQADSVKWPNIKVSHDGA